MRSRGSRHSVTQLRRVQLSVHVRAYTRPSLPGDQPGRTLAFVQYAYVCFDRYARVRACAGVVGILSNLSGICRTLWGCASIARWKKNVQKLFLPFPSPPNARPLPCRRARARHPRSHPTAAVFFARTLERDPGRGQKSTTAWRASRRRRLARHLGLHQAGRARALPTLTRRRLRPPAHHLALRSQPLRLGATSLSVLRVERKSAPCFTYVPCVQCQLWKLHRSMFHLRTYPT